MREWIFDNIEHALCVLLLISRVGDVATTYLVTPSLEFEANPIARRLGWRFAILSLLACLVPYVSVEAGLAMLVPFLLVSAANAGRIWVARTLGEKAHKALLLDLASRSKLGHALSGVAASTFFLVLLGLVLLFFYPDPYADWGFWFSVGLIGYGVAIGLYGSLWLLRLFKEARLTETTGETIPGS